MSIQFIHPGTHSRIIDDSTVYITSQGTTKLFSAFTSDRGIDNEIQFITSPSEFVFKYGNPDMRKHGQAGYNIMNWLKSGGGLYALRVMPEDAGFANAIVNIQTKVGLKEVYNHSDELVTVPNVTLRPSVSYTDINNISVKTLEFDELRKEKNLTIDGFTNNMLFAVVPRGRGAGYNDLGFKITLTNEMDSTYEFRLYNFEVTRRMKSGAMETVEGPFKVVMDPEAMSESGESLFIKYVIETYSEYYDIIFNTANYIKLGETINPHVHPNKLDMLNGITRKNDLTDEIETYHDPITGRDEDIHLYINEYINGKPTGRKNIIDASDELESSISSMDNTYRIEDLNDIEKTIERLTLSLSAIRKITPSNNPYANMVNYLIDEDNGVIDETMVKIEVLYDDIDKLREDYKSDKSLDNLNKLERKIREIRNIIELELLKSLREALDYSKVSGNVDDSLALETGIRQVKNVLYSLKSFNLSFTSMKMNISKLELERDNVIMDNVNSGKITFISSVISEVEDILVKLLTLDNEDLDEADELLLVNKTQLDELKELDSLINDKYVIEEDLDQYIIDAMKLTETLLRSTLKSVNGVLVEINIDRLGDIKDDLKHMSESAIDLIELAVSMSETVEENIILETLSSMEDRLISIKQLTYRTLVQNFDSSVQLRFGSDGSLSLDNPNRSKEIDKLLISAYSGLIDETLLDKRIYPIDMVMDANYSTPVKDALVRLVSVRKDFIAILDTGFQPSPQAAINYRRNNLQVDNFRVALFTQDFIVNDSEFTGQNIKVTSPYFLASKIPENDTNHGIHWNFVGPRRGSISGFEKMSFNPNPEWKEQLYKTQINYIEQDTVRTKFGSQLTSQTVVSALSNISNVRTLLRIMRDVELLMEDYQFEFNDSATSSAAQLSLNGYLSQWVTNRACDNISGTVYASDYDRKQKLLRVRVELIFNSIVERIAIDLVVGS